MVAPDLHAPPASPRAPRSWQKNRSMQKKTYNSAQQLVFCNSQVFAKKSLELCARVRSVLQHLHTFPHACTPPLLDAVLNQQSFAKKQVDTLRNHTQSLLGQRARGFLHSRVATVAPTGRTWWEAPLMGGSRSPPACCKNPPRLYHVIAPCTTNSCAIWCELLLLCSVLSQSDRKHIPEEIG